MDMKSEDCYMIRIHSHKEDDGILSVIEQPEIPFDVKRVFWVHNTSSGAVRGNHATIDTKLVLVTVSGCCDVTIDDGVEKKIIHLNNSENGVFINNMLWRSMSNFSDDCVVMAFCDQRYGSFNGIETIDDYDIFLEKRGEKSRFN